MKEEIISGLILGIIGIKNKSKILKILFVCIGTFIILENLLPKSVTDKQIAWIKSKKNKINNNNA